MSDLNLSILLRKPGTGTPVISIQRWIFIHACPSFPFFVVHQTAVRVGMAGDVMPPHSTPGNKFQTEWSFTQCYIFRSTLQ